MSPFRKALDESLACPPGFAATRQPAIKKLFQLAQSEPLADIVEANALVRLQDISSRGEAYGRVLAALLSRDGFWEALDARSHLRRLMVSNPHTFIPALLAPANAQRFCEDPGWEDNLSWLAGLSASQEAPLPPPSELGIPLDSAEPWPAEMLSISYRHHRHAQLAAVFCSAEPEWLQALSSSGVADRWLIACLAAGASDKALAAAKKLPPLSAEQSSRIFASLLLSQFPQRKRLAMAWGGSLPQKHSRDERERHAEAQAQDGQEKAIVWQAVIDAGAATVRNIPLPCEATETEHPERIPDLSGAWALAIEGARGGALDPGSSWAWEEFAASGHGAPVEKDAWNGKNGMEVCRALGSQPAQVNLSRLLARHSGARLDRSLAALANSGSWISPEEQEAVAQARGSSLLGLLFNHGMGPEGIGHACAMGASLASRSEGKPLLRSLFESEAGMRSEAFGALVAAARAAGEDILSTRDVDGSAPVHWACAALSAEATRALAAHGADLLERDKNGHSAGHWIAKSYSGSSAKKTEPLLLALSELGFDWGCLDNKGISALSALASKGSIISLAAAIRANPDAIHAKGFQALSAAEILIRRGGAALAEFESMVFEITMATPSASSPLAKTRQRI